MKKTLFKTVFAALSAAVLFSTVAHADFAKSKTYTVGQFTDVPTTEWFAESVKDAYEYGIMNGNSETTFNPSGTLTVAEGVTVAARINETVTGKKIEAVSGGEWYKQYVDYCVNNGIFTADKFNDYTRTIRRSEMAELMAAVSGTLPEINNATKLPDVPYDAEYANSVFKLYKAGILTGNDDFGTFAPESELKRSEISAMAVRIADSAKRVSKTFKESPVRAYYDAYTIIETMSGSGSDNGIANGWNYDFRFNVLSKNGLQYYYIADSNDEIYGSIKRDFNPEKSGVLILDTYVTAKSKNGCVYVTFKDSSFNDVVGIGEKNGKFALMGANTVVSDIAFPENTNTLFALSMTIDLDKNTATAYINNKLIGTVNIADCEISRLELGCRKIGTGYIELGQTYLTKNYAINDKFISIAENIGEKPASWNVSGDFAIDKTDSMLGTDKYSVKADSKSGSASVATKSFDAIGGKVLFETNILLPDKVDGASVSLTCGANEALKIETKGGKFVIGDTIIHDYIPNVWQSLYIEADTKNGTALVKMNGKKKATVPFSGTYFDGVKIAFTPDKDAVMWFDDVQISNVISHADYPSYPKVAESKDYNVGVNVCWLWRDSQSREGWDATSPFEEFDTYMGYYDEGLKETADWELKWMAEHGIDFIHACWYAPNNDIKEPFKQMRISHEALHDGYMNAEYSDLVDFCIMWEVGFQGCSSAENFKKYIWPYWKEYYFSDERYVRLDNKALLTIYIPSTFDKMLGGKESAIEVVKFMEAELKEMGYDGLLLWFTTQSVKNDADFNSMKEYGVEIATYAYHWHKAGYDPAVQIDNNKLYRGYAEKAASHHVPTVSVGFNDVGRNDSRSPLITAEDHLTVCNDIKKTLSEYTTGTWRDNTVMISTWNEFSEGTYIVPTNSHGFSYLENIRKVFTDDTSDHTALDVKLTPAQMIRVGRTYPPEHNPLRWLQLGETDENGNSDSVSTNPDDLTVIKKFNLATEIKVSHSAGVLAQSENNFVGHAQATDFGIVTSQANQISAKQCPILHIRMKATDTGTGEIFFTTDVDKSWNGAKSKTFTLKEAGEFHDYYIDMSSSALWSSTITKIRIDPNDRICDFEITCIEVLGDSSYIPKKTAKLEVNAQQIDLSYAPVFTEDGDIEIAAEERNRGFFSMMGLYHEYHRSAEGGVLKIYTKDNTEIVYTAGSDKVTVNGKADDLGYKFYFKDGLPVIRLKKLLSYTGYNYSIDDDTIKIQACSDEDYYTLTNRRSDAFEFNIEGDIEGFTCIHTELTQGGGRLMGAASTTGTADPQITRSVNIDTNKYSGCTVGMLYSEELVNPKSPPQLFFTQGSGFTAAKVVDGTYDLTGKKEGDIVEIHFDLRSNENYTGTVSKIRFDPFSAILHFEIDYIRFIEGSVLDDIALKYEKGASIDFTACTTGNFSPSKITKDIFEATSVNNDPLINVTFTPFTAENYQAIRLRMKTSKDGYAQFFFATDSNPGISEEKSFKVALTASDEIQDYYILTGSNSNWKGTVNYIRFDPVNTPETSFSIEAVDFMIKKGGSVSQVTPPAEPVEDLSLKYETATSLDFTKWSTGNFSPTKVTKEVFEGTSENSDPLISVKFEPFAAESYPAIRLRMKASKSGFAQFFFATDSNPGISEEKSFKVNITASDEVKDYYIITGKNSNWKDTITSIRFDPINTSETSFVIEAVDFLVEK